MIEDPNIIPSTEPVQKPKRKYLPFIIVIVALVVGVASVLLFLHVQALQKEAQRIDAAVDWKAVGTGKKPIYIIQYKVVKIEHSDLSDVEKTIEEQHLKVDIWNDEGPRTKFLFGAATDTAIRVLQEQGYTVTVLYNSFDEYQKAMEEGQ